MASDILPTEGARSTTYYVGRDELLSDGKRLLGAFLDGPFSTLDVAKAALSGVPKGAYVVRVETCR